MVYAHEAVDSRKGAPYRPWRHFEMESEKYEEASSPRARSEYNKTVYYLDKHSFFYLRTNNYHGASPCYQGALYVNHGLHYSVEGLAHVHGASPCPQGALYVNHGASLPRNLSLFLL